MYQLFSSSKDSSLCGWLPAINSLLTEMTESGDLGEICGSHQPASGCVEQQRTCLEPLQPGRLALKREETGSMEDDEDCLMESATCTHSSINLSAASRLLDPAACVPFATTAPLTEELELPAQIEHPFPCTAVLAAVSPSPSPSLAVEETPSSPPTSKPKSPSPATSSQAAKAPCSGPASPKSSRVASTETPVTNCEQIKQEAEPFEAGTSTCTGLPEPDELAASLLIPEAWEAAAAVPHDAGMFQGPAKTKGRTVTGRRKCTTERNRDKVQSLQTAAMSVSSAALLLMRHNMWLCVRVRVMEAFVQIRDDQVILLQHMEKVRQQHLQPGSLSTQCSVSLEGVQLSSQEVQAIQHTSLSQFLTSVRELTSDAVRTMCAYMGTSCTGQVPLCHNAPGGFQEGMCVVEQPDGDWEAVVKVGGRQRTSMQRLEHMLTHIQHTQPLTWQQTTLYRLTKNVTCTLATVMRAVAMTQPHLLIQLTTLNLETGQEERAPAEHWERVMTATALRPQQLLELRMALQVYRDACGKIQARHAEILQEYQQRVLPHHPNTPATAWANNHACHDGWLLASVFADTDGFDSAFDWLPADCPHGGSCSEAGAGAAAEGAWITRLSRADQLALCQELAALGRQQQSTYQLIASFIFGRMMTPFQVACCKVHAWPYLPDPLAMEEVVLRQHVASGAASDLLIAERQSLVSTLSAPQVVGHTGLAGQQGDSLKPGKQGGQKRSRPSTSKG